MGDTVNFTAFLASIAHDIKNSLSMMLSSLDEVATKCTPETCHSHKHLSQIQYEASRVNNNLIQLLTLYKMDTDQFGINISQYPVSEVLQETILQNKPLLDFKGFEVSTECPEDLYWFFDRELLMGIINNIMSNAFRHAKGKIKMTAAESEGQFILTIEDDGEGYPEELLESEGQTSRGVSFKTGSTGLGLYFASMVAKMHKNKGKEGFINISNGGEYGGSCFSITLP